jgi:hypothetical protein
MCACACVRACMIHPSTRTPRHDTDKHTHTDIMRASTHTRTNGRRFYDWIWGGADRLSAVRAMLETFAAARVPVYIATKGLAERSPDCAGMQTISPLVPSVTTARLSPSPARPLPPLHTPAPPRQHSACRSDGHSAQGGHGRAHRLDQGLLNRPEAAVHLALDGREPWRSACNRVPRVPSPSSASSVPFCWWFGAKASSSPGPAEEVR